MLYTLNDITRSIATNLGWDVSADRIHRLPKWIDGTQPYKIYTPFDTELKEDGTLYWVTASVNPDGDVARIATGTLQYWRSKWQCVIKDYTVDDFIAQLPNLA